MGTYHCDGVRGLKGQELEMRVGWRRKMEVSGGRSGLCTEKFPECQDRSFAEGQPDFRLLSASILLLVLLWSIRMTVKLSTLFNGYYLLL